MRIGRTLAAIAGATALAAIAAAPTAVAADKPLHPRSYLAGLDRTKPSDLLASRVMGGNVAYPKAWPWQVALIDADKKSPFDGQFCGGSLVTTQWVMTAAHCVYDEDEDGDTVLLKPGAIKVLAGTNLLEDGTGDLIDVVEVIPHPDYDDEEIDNDVALLKLARIPRINPLTPIRIPTRNTEAQVAPPGTQATVVGWGRMEDGEFPTDLREVGIRIRDRGECNQAVFEKRQDRASDAFQDVLDTLQVSEEVGDKIWKMLTEASKPPLTGNMICSGSLAGGKGSCSGDSGGPLMVALADGTFLQVGIVSWGFSGTEKKSCDVDSTFSAYTRVANYADWLKATIERRR
ncbi:MAG: serine protease [Bauldia sp.]